MHCRSRQHRSIRGCDSITCTRALESTLRCIPFDIIAWQSITHGRSVYGCTMREGTRQGSG